MKAVVQIPVSTLNLAAKLSGEDCKTLIKALVNQARGVDLPELNDIQTAIMEDYSLWLEEAEQHKRKVSATKRECALKRWSKAEQPPAAEPEPGPEILVLQPDEPVVASKKKPVTRADYDWVAPEMRQIFDDWCSYRRGCRKSFKTEKSLRQNYNLMIKLSGGNPDCARAIVDNSISNEYQGLFALKNNQPNGTNTRLVRNIAAEQQLIAAVANNCLEQMQREAAIAAGEEKFVPRQL